MASTLLEALALALVGLELELELVVHPAVPSRPAVTTVAPSQVPVRRLKMFIRRFVCDPSDAWRRGVERAGEWILTRKRPNFAHLLKAPLRAAEPTTIPARFRVGLVVRLDPLRPQLVERHLQVGTKRVVGKETYILIHNPASWATRPVAATGDEMLLIQQISDQVLSVFADRAKAVGEAGTAAAPITRAQIEMNWNRTDWWLDSTEALKLGLVDEVRP